jgi:YidC/Oxa1 family membrane protein insertase
MIQPLRVMIRTPFATLTARARFMDNQRLILWSALAAILFLNYQAWQHDYAPVTAAQSTVSAPSAASGSVAVAKGAELTDGLPALPESGTQASVAGSASLPANGATPGLANDAVVMPALAERSALVHVRTDVLDVTISLQGGDIRDATLLHYPIHKDTPNELVKLFGDAPNMAQAVFQWGLTAGGADAEPNHKALFSAVQTQYTLQDGEAGLSVPLTWTNGAGINVTRTLHFARGRYAIELDQRVQNDSTTPWRARAYSQVARHWQHVDRSMWNPDSYAFVGPALYDGKKYQKLDLEKPDADKLPKAALAGGWAAAMQHHFVAAIVPDPATAQEYNLSVKDKNFLLRVVGPVVEVAPGRATDFKDTLYVGPKLQEQLALAGPKLELTADYGRLTIIAQPLFWVLDHVHRVIGNWGFTIIIVTFLIKLCFYPLAQTSGRSMAKMRALGPRMKAIQERYKDDREQLGKQMMELYKREKVNPVAGCLPMVVQIPVFISFYWVLMESVEMRQAPFLFWVQDLSVRDPYWVLPALMGVAMFGQFKMNPAPPDPVQAKVFAFMPLVMTGMMAFFPAGLVLYWITNTVLSIAQQWRINKMVEATEHKVRG